MGIAEFLEARLAEDEAATISGDCKCGASEPQRPDCSDRILYEVESKRRIMAEIQSWKHVVSHETWYVCPAAPEADEEDAGPCNCGRDRKVGRLLRLLALPYASHPDYRQEWAL